MGSEFGGLSVHGIRGYNIEINSAKYGLRVIAIKWEYIYGVLQGISVL